jgi:hypothetical protein
MSTRRVVAAIACTTACMTWIAAASGCRRGAPSPIATDAGAPPERAPDRLTEGELAPGVETAHDLALPRGARVERHFGSAVHAVVPLGPEQLALFVRRQAEEEPEILVGPERTLLPRLRVRGASDDHRLRVEILPAGGRPDVSTLIVDRFDTTLPVSTATTDDERMRAVGLTPDGKLQAPDRIE